MTTTPSSLDPITQLVFEHHGLFEHPAGGTVRIPDTFEIIGWVRLSDHSEEWLLVIREKEPMPPMTRIYRVGTRDAEIVSDPLDKEGVLNHLCFGKENPANLAGILRRPRVDFPAISVPSGNMVRDQPTPPRLIADA